MIIVSQFLQFYRSKLKFQRQVEKDGPHPNTFWETIQADGLIKYR
jgi:hypothetical protein